MKETTTMSKNQSKVKVNVKGEHSAPSTVHSIWGNNNIIVKPKRNWSFRPRKHKKAKEVPASFTHITGF